MEKMYQEYKEVAEFRLIYIKEAHAADSNWPMQYAIDKGINQHTSYEERCETAEMLMKDKKLNIPVLIDGFDNAVGEAYAALPDRVFLVRKDGKLAVSAARGPWGFKPGLDAVEKWLEEYKDTGEEPNLPSAEELKKMAEEAEKEREALMKRMRRRKKK